MIVRNDLRALREFELELGGGVVPQMRDEEAFLRLAESVPFGILEGHDLAHLGAEEDEAVGRAFDASGVGLDGGGGAGTCRSFGSLGIGLTDGL